MKKLFSYLLIAMLSVGLGCATLCLSACKDDGKDPNPTLELNVGKGGNVLVVYDDVSETVASSTSENFEVEKGTKITLTATADDEYRFVSWTIGTEEFTIAEKTLTLNQTTSVTASFALREVNVTIKVEGREDKVIRVSHLTNIYHEATLDLPNPGAGYEYVAKIGDEIVTADTKLDQDAIVVVTKQPINYTLTFKDGETVVDTVNYNVETISSVVAPTTPTYAGYTTAWETYDLTTLGNKTVNLVKTPIQYSISFNLGEGSCADLDNLLTDGKLLFTVESDTITLPTNATKEGFEFGGWATSDGTAITQIPATELIKDSTDIVLNAVWHQVFTATINLNGGTAPAEFASLIVDGKITFTSNHETITLPTTGMTKENCLFVKWVDEDGATITEITQGTSKNLTISAVWENVYTATFNLAGGVAGDQFKAFAKLNNEVFTFKFTKNTNVEIPTDITKRFNTFAGWVDESNNKISSIANLENNITITATWQEVPTLTFEYVGLEQNIDFRLYESLLLENGKLYSTKDKDNVNAQPRFESVDAFLSEIYNNLGIAQVISEINGTNCSSEAEFIQLFKEALESGATTFSFTYVDDSSI